MAITVPKGKLLTPGGAQGPTGAVGNPGVSLDANNLARAGSDSQIYVPNNRFNSIGNPNFEVDQINCGTMVAAANAKIIDRWSTGKTGTMVVSAGQMTESVLLPGTNFQISRSYHRIILTTVQASLAAGDYLRFYQTVEGPQFRELQFDVHSMSLLVRCSVPLKFGMFLADLPTVSRALTKLCTITTANTWTLIPLANLPIFPSAGTFTNVVGSPGYLFGIALAAGTQWMNLANDTWQTVGSANYMGAVGQDNFAAKAVNSTFDIAFVQHEPGPVCSPLIDLPFERNLDSCLRHYQKTYLYGAKAGSANQMNQMRGYWTPVASVTFFINNSFLTPMAKTPTVTVYHPWLGTPNAYSYNGSTTAATTVTGVIYVTEFGFGGFQSGGAPTAGVPCYWHYSADTGW